MIKTIAAIVLSLSTLATAEPLRLFDALLFTDRPPSSTLGMEPLVVLYEGALWPGGASRVDPPLQSTIDALVAPLAPGTLVCIDIETWRINRTDDDTIRTNLLKYIETVRRFKQSRPDLLYGYYAAIPAAEWWTVGDPAKKDNNVEWRRRNLLYWPLAREVDVLFPSLYTFYGDPMSVRSWPIYAEQNLEQARQFGKPVYPFIWPMYHENDPKWRGKWIPPQDWLAQLRTLEGLGVDGIVIWGGWQQPWDWDAPWWRVTQQWWGLRGWE